MRRLLILIFIVFSAVSSIYARPQLHDTARVFIGTSHGIVGSGILFNPNVAQDLIFGYNGGIMMSYEAQKGRSLQIEVNFSQRGWKEKDNIFARRLNYIEIPTLAQYYFGDKSGFTINAGPKISFLVSEKILYNNYILTDDESKPTQHSDEIKNKFDYGITGGIGYKFFIEKQVFMIEARVNFSLSTIYGNSAKDYFDNSNHFNVAVNLGWMIRVK